jgi:hypothetical protein
MAISMRRAFLIATGTLVLGVAAGGLLRLPAPVEPDTAATAAAAPDSTLASDVNAILAADQTSAGPIGSRDVAAPRALRRLGAARRVIHATVLVDLPKAGITTIQIDHGTISAVNATSLTVAETGGGSPSVTLGADTRVRREGQKAAVADLKAGDEVFVMSKVESTGAVAYLVVVPRS